MYNTLQRILSATVLLTILPVLLLSQSPGVSSQQEIGQSISKSSYDFFGTSVAQIGDVDDDGVPDIAVGVEEADRGSFNTGVVWILFMNADGTVKSGREIGEGLGFSNELFSGDNFGSSVTGIGDLNDDGTPDIAVGARSTDSSGMNHSFGAVWIVFLGRTGRVAWKQQISATVGGMAPGDIDSLDQFGRSVCAVDTTVDIIAVGSSGDDNGQGAVWYLALNSDGTVNSKRKITSSDVGNNLNANDGFGTSIASLGDLDGDNNPDVAVGAPFDDDGGSGRGAVYILFLNTDGSVKSFQKISNTAGGFTGTLDDLDLFGRAVTYVGDTDCDNLPEIAVGACLDDDGGMERGAVWVLELNSSGTVTGSSKISSSSGSFAGPLQDYDQFGTSVAGLGTAYGSDAVPDIAVGEPNDGYSNRGSAWALFLQGENNTPTALCQNITVELDATGNARIFASQVDDGSYDDCGIADTTLDKSNFTCADVGMETVTLTVTDVSGNPVTCTATVTIEDNIAPEVTCNNVTVQLDASGNGSITVAQVENSSSDACGIATKTLSKSSFTCADVGTNTVTLTVTDNNGNPATCSATVTVEDNVAPVVTCNNVTVQLDAAGDGTLTVAQVENSSSDACGIASKTLSKSSFTCADVGTNTVTLTVTDNNGNPATCTATVTVEDNVAPVVTCNNVTVQLDAAGNGSITVAQVENSSSDACGIANKSLSKSSFTCANVGTSTVTLTVTDNNGNPATCTATVTVEDNIAPTVTCNNVTVQLDASGNGSITVAQVENSSSDACGIASKSLSKTNFTCADVGTNTVTLTVTDNNGNPATCSATVTVEDNVAPVVTCNNVTVQLDAAGNGTLTVGQVENSSSDACGIASKTLSKTNFTCADVGSNTVTLTVTDNSGNPASCTATVTVEDNVPPAALCNNVTVILDATGNGSITIVQVDNGSNDACGIASTTLSRSNFTCADVGPNNVTLTVTDVNGNSATCVSVVTVIDNTPPSITAPADLLLSTDPGVCYRALANISLGVPTVSDNCPGVTYFNNAPATFPKGKTAVTWTARDASGNTATSNQTVTIIDTEKPKITAPPALVEGMDPGKCGRALANTNLGTPVATDNCPGLVVTNNAPNEFPKGITIVTWTAKDEAGNFAQATQMVTIEDREPPVIKAPGRVIVSTDPNSCQRTLPVILGGPVVSDNCTGVTHWNNAPAVYPFGTTIVTWTARDAVGNTSTSTQEVVVKDNTPPSIYVSLSPNMLTPADQTMRTIQAYVTLNDNCAGTRYELTSITSSELDAGLGPNDIPNDIAASFNNQTSNFSLRAEQFSFGRTYTVKYTAIDIGSNSTQDVRAVFVPFSWTPKNVVVSDDRVVPEAVTLEQNFPNPFNPATVIRYAIPEDGSVRLTVYDVHSREVASLVDQVQTAGTYSVRFDASGLPSGSYMYVLEAAGKRLSKRMNLVK